MELDCLPKQLFLVIIMKFNLIYCEFLPPGPANRRVIMSDNPSEVSSNNSEFQPGLRALISGEVHKQLSQERETIRAAANIGLKIIGAAFVLLFGIFTVFGLTTWSDIKKQTADYVKIRVDELIQKSDTETGVKQMLNDLVNRAIVNSMLSSERRSDHRQESRKDFELTKNDWDRLRSWLKLENLGTQEFSDVLTILDGQSEERKKVDANGFLSDMLYPPKGSSYEWIKKQPDKRLAIMSNFRHRDMGGPATEIARSVNQSLEMRLKALIYLAEVRYTEGFDRVIALASSATESELRTQALLSAAPLRPADPRVDSEVKKLIKGPGSSDNVLAALRIVKALWSGEERYDSESDMERRVIALSRELLTFAFDHDIYFSVTSRPNVEARVAAFVRQSSRSAGRVDFGPAREFDGIKPYWALMEDAANKGNIVKLTQLMLRGVPYVGAEVTLSSQSKIDVIDQTGQVRTLDGDHVQKLILRRPRGPGPRGEGLIGEWKSSDNQTENGRCTQLSGGGFNLSLYFRSPSLDQ